MYRGFYINLDRDNDKREAIQKNLSDIGLAGNYERVEAVDGTAVSEQYSSMLTPGELGCWMSHLGILQGQIGQGRHIHILEDDALVHKGIAKVFAGFCEQVTRWDLFFTDFFVPHDIYLFKLLHGALEHYRQSGELRIFRLDNIKFACATSYFVHKDSIGKLYRLLRSCGRENKPFDLTMRDAAACGEVVAYAVIPFFSTLSSYCQQSSIRSYDNYRRAFDLYRHSFYVDAKLEQLAEALENGCDRKSELDRPTEIFLSLTRKLCERDYVIV